MITNMFQSLFGSKNDRFLKTLSSTVDRINSLEETYKALSDDELRATVGTWREEVEKGRDLDDLLCDSFALVREAGMRVMGMRHYDVQLIGGQVLHQGKIAEMKTGEGKTYMATLPVILNALTGRGVHVVTVNDYLASRDAEWMGELYTFLGFTSGAIVAGIEPAERRRIYGSDITYGTNNEFGFDYLRDNMSFTMDHLVQREHHFAIVDEVDSILIDEARTPLIISGPAEQSGDLYMRVNTIVPKLKAEDHFTLDEKAKAVLLTDEGVARCEEILQIDNLYDPTNISLQHHIMQGLKAHHLFKNEVDYIVKDGEVVIVDEFTGRLMSGRRYSDGLHQALEAKERVNIKAENQTLASITFQNYFRMYDKLAGMTGTADTEAVEFKQIYDLEVAAIPTHQPMIRDDMADVILRTQAEKYQAICEQIAELHKKGQPVLVGTVSIHVSELIAKQLKKLRVPHSVLNAKHHEQEAQIVAEAGQKGKVTIATNMAGRGTDIKLGEGVIELGGLFILGTERHESRRIDNQLRGRSGRQGDPGASRFYLSMEDQLMRIFGSDRISGLMERLGMREGEAIENKMVSKAIENAQRKVEAHHFEIRKTLLDYDDVMNQQREVIYTQRREIIESRELSELIDQMVGDLLDELYGDPEKSGREETDEDDVAYVRGQLETIFNAKRNADYVTDGDLPEREEVEEWFAGYLAELKERADKHFHEIVSYFTLDSLDRHWKEHLLNMDHLREGIGLRGYGQKDPKQEYKREGYELFSEMLFQIKESTVRALSHIRIEKEVREEEFQHEEPQDNLTYAGSEAAEAAAAQPVKREAPKVGRNAPCPCGSGKKYKKCCG